MKPRILRTNRRERYGRGPILSDAILLAAGAVLSLVSAFGRHREPPKVQERLSTLERDRYAEHLHAELRRIGR